MSENDILEEEGEIYDGDRIVVEGAKDFVEIKEFEKMGLKDEIVKGLKAGGLDRPNALQQVGIPFLCNNNENRKPMLVEGKHGSGKITMALISIMQNIDETKDTVQALILVPQREVGTKILRKFVPIAENSPFRMHCCIGGTPVKFDEEKFEETKPQIIVGTPGRIKHLLRKRILNTEDMQMVVLEDADILLDRGIKGQIYQIFRRMPRERSVQVVCFGLLLAPGLLKFASQHCKDAVKLFVNKMKPKDMMAGFQQFRIDVLNDREKFAHFIEFLEKNPKLERCVLFCNSNRRVNWLVDRFARQEREKNEPKKKEGEEEEEEEKKEKEEEKEKEEAEGEGEDEEKKEEEEEVGRFGRRRRRRRPQHDPPITVVKMTGNLRDREEMMRKFDAGETKVFATSGTLLRNLDVGQIRLLVNYDIPRTARKLDYLWRVDRAGKSGRKAIILNFVTRADVYTLKYITQKFETEILPCPEDINKYL